jgi:hypothetical protein
MPSCRGQEKLYLIYDKVISKGITFMTKLRENSLTGSKVEMRGPA